MKSVVMISHGFPPEGNAGVYRPLRFVRRLSSHGWRPIVIAEDTNQYERYDPGLLDLVPPDTEIIRVRNRDPWVAVQQRRIGKLKKRVSGLNSERVQQIYASQERPLRSLLRSAVHRVESMVYYPDPSMCWIRPATKAAAAACRRSRADVVWATGGPWSSLVVAGKVSRQTGTPYILDLRDAWTLTHDEFQTLQPEWAKQRDRKLLSRLFAGAQAIVVRYMSEAESYYRVYPGLFDPGKVHLIPNGYEGSISPYTAPQTNRCTLLYTGGVAPYWYENLLEAIKQLKADSPGIAASLKITFVGEGTELIANLARRLDIGDVVEASGVVPFSEVTRLYSQAHALLLLGWKPLRGHELGGSKIFNYLKAGRPIIGILPNDENTRILQSVGVETIAYAGSVAQINDVLRRAVDAWSHNKLSSLLPNPVACESYSAERQTRALVRALEGLPPEERFEPGVCGVPPSLEKIISAGPWVKSNRAVSGFQARAASL